MSYFPPTGSTVAFQSDPTKLVGTMSVVGTLGPASISGVGVFNTNNIGNGSVITVSQGSIAAVIIGGSIAASFTPPANQSVSGTVNLGPTSVAALQGTNPWFVQLTSGSVITTGGNSSVQVVGQIPPTSVSGVGVFNTNPVGSGSVITVPQPASVSGVGIFNVNNIGSGSVVTLFSQSPSIVGTYAEDAPHTTADKGLFVMGVRNETLSSITSADGDYSPHVVGAAGEVVIANSPFTKWISGQTSVMYGPSVQAIAPQGASVFTYITGIQLANPSANNALVKFTGGLGSVLAWTMAPANGGSNIYFQNALKTGENSGFSASISGTGSVYLSAQGFIAKI